MPLAARKKPTLDPAAMYVAWESFATTRHDLTVRAGTRLRGDHEAVQGWPQFFLPADTPDDEVDRHRAREYYRELATVNGSARQTNPEMDVRILEAAEPLRAEDAVVAIRTTGLAADVTGPAIDPTGQLRTVHAGHRLRRDDALVRRDPDAFVDVTNGIARERAVVALQRVSSQAEDGTVRAIEQGQWADRDDPLVTSNQHVFERVGFE
jgi:hypothetical protein